jgi:GAF domain-containing protein
MRKPIRTQQRPHAEEPPTEARARDLQSHAAARAHKIIAECSHVLVRASEERKLLHDMCRIVVDSGGYLLAWVGLVRHDAACTIEPVASAGDHDNYLGSIKLSWGDNQFGRGPAGMAVRTGKPQAVRDVRTNPNFAAWRDQALARGYQVLASLPLIYEGETLGVFGMFAGELNALDTGELELLSELAHDIAFGIGNLRMRAAQQRESCSGAATRSFPIPTTPTRPIRCAPTFMPAGSITSAWKSAICARTARPSGSGSPYR